MGMCFARSLRPRRFVAGVAVALMLVLLVPGCRSGGTGGSRAVARGGSRAAARGAGVDLRLSEGYGLLHALLAKQGGVDGILIVKGASGPGKDLIRRIAVASRDGAERIRGFAREDDRLRVDWTGLREVEQRARDQIEGATGKELLFSGDDFEVRLLLTQSEATRYAVGLARVLLKIDRDEQRNQWLLDFVAGYDELRQEVVRRLAVVEGEDT